MLDLLKKQQKSAHQRTNSQNKSAEETQLMKQLSSLASLVQALDQRMKRLRNKNKSIS
jgi:predicted nuclease with TOPRIM domain